MAGHIDPIENFRASMVRRYGGLGGTCTPAGPLGVSRDDGREPLAAVAGVFSAADIVAMVAACQRRAAVAARESDRSVEMGDEQAKAAYVQAMMRAGVDAARRHEEKLLVERWDAARRAAATAKPPVDVAAMAADVAQGKDRRESRAVGELHESVGKTSTGLYAAYKRIVALQGMDSDQGERLVTANADDREFIAMVVAHRRAVAALEAQEREIDAAEEAALRADVRLRRAARGRTVLGAAWWLVKAAAVAGTLGYAGRLAWVDLAARYWG